MQRGSDYVTIRPAISGGKRAWLVTRDWSPAGGYFASGVEDTVLDFEHGCAILLEHGTFAHLWQTG